MKRTFSLLLALLVLLGMQATLAEASAAPVESAAPAPAETAVPDPTEDPVLATVAGMPIFKSEVDAVIPAFIENQYIADASEYSTVVNAIIQNRVLKTKVNEMGFAVFTQEEMDAFLAEAQTMWQEYVNYFADYYQAEDTEEARLVAVAQVEAELAASGMSVEAVAGELRQDAAQDKMNEYMLAGYAPSDAEIAEVFNLYGESYRQQYEGNIGQYEFNVEYNGEESWYTPEGYRGIIHILLIPDNQLLADYQAKSAAFEEQQNADSAEPTPAMDIVETAVPDASPEGTDAPKASAEPTEEPISTPEPVTAEALEAARQAVLDSRKVDLDAISTRFAAGESFAALIAEFGEDPGMEDATRLQEGYKVHPQSVMYDPVFTAAAFSDKMQKIGDVSDPVVGTHGIHILQYLRDVPSGLIMTDEIKAEITEYLSARKLNDAYTAAFPVWEEQAGIVRDEEAIALATMKAQEAAQSPEELEPEAVPETSDAPEATAAP